MAMNFAKNNRSVAFNPTSAFPLDARSYFESLESAQAAAAKAEEVGSTNTVYYYGQTISVVENNVATLYIIQPNKTLAPITSGDNDEPIQFEVDSKQFVFENGLLSLKDFKTAVAGQVLTVGVDGNLCWITPIDTYSKVEIDSKIAAAGHLKRKIVNSIVEIVTYMDSYNDADQYIFMVPRDEASGSDKYDEYIVIKTYNEFDELISQEIEAVGTWEVNLDDYAKVSDLTKYAQTSEVSAMISQLEQNVFDTFDPTAERNVIANVSTDFTIDQNRVLNLNQLDLGKISGLPEQLAQKVDKVTDVSMLVSTTDRSKLDALTLNGEKLEINGKISAGQIDDLEEWLSDNVGSVPGLSEYNLNYDLFTKLDTMQYIKEIDETWLSLESGKLGVSSQITNIVSQLNTLQDLSDQVETLASEVSDLSDRLIWQNI